MASVVCNEHAVTFAKDPLRERHDNIVDCLTDSRNIADRRAGLAPRAAVKRKSELELEERQNTFRVGRYFVKKQDINKVQ